jgi:DNA-binding response OmpR family regulator
MLREMAAKRVLAIEDEKDILDMYEYLFNDVGYEVGISLTGEHIQEQIDEFHPDLILLDIRIGNLNGGEICRQIKNNPKTNPIVVLLVSGEINLKEIMRYSGANACMSKPFDINYLLKQMEQLLAV